MHNSNGQPRARRTIIRVALLLFLATIATLIAACGDDSGPGQVTGNSKPLQIKSGVFDVTATSLFNGCNSPLIFDGAYNVQLADTAFSMGSDWFGIWDAKALLAVGESQHVIRELRTCTITEWTSINLTFTSKNAFTGTVVFRHRLSGQCDNQTQCQSSWRIFGTRQ